MVAYTFYESDNRVRRYAEALASRGDHVDAIALRRDGQPRCETIRGVRVFRIQNRVIDEMGPFSYLRKLLLFFFRSMWFLTIGAARRRYDVIHVHSVPDFQVFATVFAKLMGARVILDIHDIVPEFYVSKFKVSERSWAFKLLLLIEKWSAAYADRVIVSNDLWKDKLTRRSLSPEKCIAIINYPDISIFRERNSHPADDAHFWMCYPGTLNHHQGLDIAVRAMALLHDKLPNLRLRIIGDGPDRKRLKMMVEQKRLGDSVFVEGLVPIEKIAEIMASVDLGVVPKRKDSFGNEAFSTKIMEFMAVGVPVVASSTRIDQFYFNDRIVQFFESGNPEDLAAKITTLVKDRQKRDSLRMEASKFIADNNWEVKKGEYLNLIDALVGRAAPRSARSTPTTLEG